MTPKSALITVIIYCTVISTIVPVVMLRSITKYAKHKGKPCPKFDGLMKASNCEAEGFADDSVPDCDSKVDIPATWSKWSSWSNCQSDYCGKQGKVIYSYKQS